MSSLSLKQRIIIHFAYRDVFNAPIQLAELKDWLGSKTVSLKEIETALSELIKEGLFETIDGLRYCIRGRTEIFSRHAHNKILASEIFKKTVWPLKLLSLVPMIRYVGISGSIAAGNATPDVTGDNKGHVDLDVFVITSPSCLWIVFFIERCFTNVLSLWKGDRHTYCFNYAMDGSFLEVHNSSIFTATEIYNLKPVFNKGRCFQSLLESNDWVAAYYPALTNNITSKRKSHLDDLLFVLFYPINLLFYFLFQLSRAIKHFSLKPILEFSIRFQINKSNCFSRFCSGNGGYEGAIKMQFSTNLKKHFAKYYNDDLIQHAFPSQTTASEVCQESLTYFSKYTYQRV
jgi:hypothetical protein